MKSTNQLNREKTNGIDRDLEGRRQVAKICSRSRHRLAREEFSRHLSRVIWALRTGTVSTEMSEDW